MAQSTLNVTPYSSALGALISGVDLSQPLSDSAFATIRQAFLDHGVIFFRDQRITPEQHLAFARRWAPIDVNRFFKPVDGYPVLLEDWIRRDGLKCLKIKLRGNDDAWDFERLVRVGRLQRAVLALQARTGTSLAQTALDVGYFDQAHMCRDFRELVGLSPSVVRAAAGTIFPIHSLLAGA